MTLADELEQLANESWMRETWYEVYDPDAFSSMITCDGDTGPLAFSVPQPAAKAIVALVNNLPAIIAALRAQEWQDIETAPRDGTRVLLWMQPMNDARFAPTDGPHAAFGTWVVWSDAMKRDGMRDGWSWYGSPLHYPTHWQPEPTPPAHDKGEPK